MIAPIITINCCAMPTTVITESSEKTISNKIIWMTTERNRCPLGNASPRWIPSTFSWISRVLFAIKKSPPTASIISRPFIDRPKSVIQGSCMLITASVFINDNESGLWADFEKWLEQLAPELPHSQYAHNGAEDNADAHLKRSVTGREVVIAITDGKLDFGPWEEVFYGEFDGKRRKRVLVKIIGE